MIWTAPEVTRIEHLPVGDERAMLESWLDWHRFTLLSKCAGLTAEQLRMASVLPSPLTLLGLVRHMAEVERWWFRRRAAGVDLPDIYCTDDNPDGDFVDVATADPQADLDVLHSEIGLARIAVTGLSLEHTFPGTRQPLISLRWVYLHMIEEYARHNGHADLIRERIDGVTGD